MGVLFWKSALTITLYKVARFTLHIHLHHLNHYIILKTIFGKLNYLLLYRR